MEMNKLTAIALIVLLLAACGGGIPNSNPSNLAETTNPQPTPTDIAPTLPMLTTAVGDVYIASVEVTPTIPPGCKDSDCFVTVNTGAFIVLWLVTEDGEQVGGNLLKACEDALLINENGDENMCYSGGIMNAKSYVAFVVKDLTPTYTLRWGDNPEVEIKP
jgi:hypothetical protein